MSYRLEYAKTNRAGCQVTLCKQNQLKIPKGALKLGVWVDGSQNSWYQWRHWGCVTPRQIANMVATVATSYDMLDGYEDLSDEDQLRVRTAIETGHVADEDLFSIDPEVNRPGAAEAKKEAEKAAKKAEREAYNAARKENTKAIKAQEKLKKKLEKQRAKEMAMEAKEEAEAEAEWEAETKKINAMTGFTDAAGPDEDNEGDDDVIQKGPKKRARVKKEEGDVAPPSKRARAKKTQPKAEPEEDNALAGEDDGQAGHAEAVEAAVKNEETLETSAPSKQKKGRAVKVKKEEASQEVEAPETSPGDAMAIDPPAPTKKGRATKAKKDEVAPEPATATGVRRSSRNKKA